MRELGFREARDGPKATQLLSSWASTNKQVCGAHSVAPNDCLRASVKVRKPNEDWKRLPAGGEGVLSLKLGAAPIRKQGVDWMILEPRNPTQNYVKSQIRPGELLLSTCKTVLKIEGLSSSSVGINTVIL